MSQTAKELGIIIAPDKIVVPEHFGIIKTARIDHTDASLAATLIEKAIYLDAVDIHHAGKPNNPFR